MITIIFVERCEGWYRNAKHLGNRAEQIAKQYAILSSRPNKNGNFDTKLPFIFFAKNAYIQGFYKIRKVSLFFNG